MFDLSSYLPYLVNRAGARLAGAFSRRLERFALTLPMWRVMAVLWDRGEQRVADLVRETSIEQSTMSRLAAAMEAKGLVSRTRSGADSRAVLVALTGHGRAVTRELIPWALETERVALDGLSEAEAETLRRLLVRVYDNAAGLEGEPR